MPENPLVAKITINESVVHGKKHLYMNLFDGKDTISTYGVQEGCCPYCSHVLDLVDELEKTLAAREIQLQKEVGTDKPLVPRRKLEPTT